MKVLFWGAAQAVTGSCHIVKAGGLKIMVDCGLHQGEDGELNKESFPVNPADVDYVLLTHAHIDHSGRIPFLFKSGFKGQVFATGATIDLCKLMLPDSGYIQESEAEWKTRKNLRKGLKPVQPLYTAQDAYDCLKIFNEIDYNASINLNKDVRVRFNDAGHALGSAIIELWERQEDGREIKTVFSGDLGNYDMPILRDPERIEEADYVVIESTYGDRIHNSRGIDIEELVDTLIETHKRGGNVVIPSFAVGRTQDIIYYLNKDKDTQGGRLYNLKDLPVVIDSPLATSATSVYRKHLDCYDQEAREYIANGDNPLDFDGLEFSIKKEDSMSLNNKKSGLVIISPSGMCEAGRIRHHLKHNLWRKECTIAFVGYQAEHTLGRRILNGSKTVKIFGEEIAVLCEVVKFEGFSGHADLNGLLDWLKGYKKKPKKVFIVHGDVDVMRNFQQTIRNEFNVEAIIPQRYQELVLS